MAQSSFTPQRKMQLLILIVVLAALRFMVMPILESQAEQRLVVTLVTQQLERAARLVQLGSLNEGVSELRNQGQTIEQTLIPHTSSSGFRLAAQQRIEGVIQSNESQVNLFDWLSQRDQIEGYLVTHQARIVVEGSALNVVQLQLAMLESIPSLSILEYSYSPPRGTGRSRKGNSRITFLIEVDGVQP